jgi:hypothetical protein
VWALKTEVTHPPPPPKKKNNGSELVSDSVPEFAASR